MKTKNLTSFIVLLMTFMYNAVGFCQGQSPRKYCCNLEAKMIDFPLQRERTNVFFADSKLNNDSIQINLINTTIDTLYLFSSYFGDDLQSSRFIHEIDKLTKDYIISFIPLIGNVSVRLSDKVIFGESSIANRSQVLYNFIKLSPNTYYSIVIHLENLFKNHAKKNNAVKSFDKYLLNKFKEAEFKFVTTSRLKGKYNLKFQFGIYNDVSLLCDQNSYYFNEFEFERQAKSFKVLTVPIKLDDSKYLLLY